MFGRINQLLPAVVVGVLGMASARADTGYLPQPGPLPLRFRIPPLPIAEHPGIPLPPTPPPSAPIALPTPSMPSKLPETTNAPPKTDKPEAVTNGPALIFEARELVTGPAPTSSTNAVISPQMLLQFFTTSTNAPAHAANAGVVTPIGFSPPPVATPAPTPPAPGKPTSSTSP
jgi:hypothetical protein